MCHIVQSTLVSLTVSILFLHIHVSLAVDFGITILFALSLSFLLCCYHFTLPTLPTIPPFMLFYGYHNCLFFLFILSSFYLLFLILDSRSYIALVARFLSLVVLFNARYLSLANVYPLPSTSTISLYSHFLPEFYIDLRLVNLSIHYSLPE